MKVGLSLSGGGVRGAAHIGVIKALCQHKIPIDCIAGTSSGSLVAMLYATGHSPDEMTSLFLNYSDLLETTSQNSKKTSVVDFDLRGTIFAAINLVLRDRITLKGFVKGDRLEKMVRQICNLKDRRTLKDTILPLAIPAVDINTSRTVMFVSDRSPFQNNRQILYTDDANLWDAIRASTAFPAVFRPKQWHSMTLVDGGVKDNMPVDVLLDQGCDRVIAVNLGYAGQQKTDIDNVLEIASQALNIMAYEMNKDNICESSYVLKPNIHDVSLLELSAIESCIERGYQAAVKEMPRITAHLYFGKALTAERGGHTCPAVI